MARYDFKAADGELVELDYPMGKAPRRVRRKGKTFVRVLSTGSGAIIRDRDHRAFSAPRRWATSLDKSQRLDSHYDKWDSKGVAVVEGAADKQRLRKALKTIRPSADWRYDP